jgi:hypothetical protein
LHFARGFTVYCGSKIGIGGGFRGVVEVALDSWPFALFLVVIVEQKVREVLKIARRVYVLRTGQIFFAGPMDALSDDAKLREVYLPTTP